MSEGASPSGTPAAAGTPTPAPPAAEPAATPTPTPEPVATPQDGDGLKGKDLETQSLGKRETGAKKQLPGVLMNDGDDFGEALFGDDDDGSGGDKKTRLRGPDGRFLKKEDGGDAPPDPGLPPSVGQEGEPQPDPTLGPDGQPQKFTFAGKEYDSQEKAEQTLKTLQGMHKSMEQRVVTAEGERDYGYTAANKWMEYAKGLEQRIAEQGQGATPQTPSSPSVGSDGQAGATANNLLEGIDMDAFEYIATRGSLAKAGEYLATELMKAVNDRVLPAKLKELEGKMDQTLQPYQQQAQHQQTVESMAAVTTQLASLKTQTGETAFPELGDTAKVEEIGRIWAQEGQSLKDLADPRGLMKAIGLYRMQKGFEGEPASPSPPAPPVTEPARAGAAATLDGESSSARVAPGSARVDPAQAAWKALDSGEMIDPVLGFARRR